MRIITIVFEVLTHNTKQIIATDKYKEEQKKDTKRLILLVAILLVLAGCGKNELPESVQHPSNPEDENTMYFLYREDLESSQYSYIFDFYDYKGKLIDTQQRTLGFDVSYSTFYYERNILLVYGIGGLYRIDLNTRKIETIDTRDISEAIMFEEKIIFVENIGYNSDGQGYSSCIYIYERGSTKKVVDVDAYVGSIAVSSNTLYIVKAPESENQKKASIAKYSFDGKKIEEFDFTGDAISDAVLKLIDGELRLVSYNGIYSFSNEKIISYHYPQQRIYHEVFVGESLKTLDIDSIFKKCLLTVDDKITVYENCDGFKRVDDTHALMSINDELVELNFETEKLVKTPIIVDKLYRYNTFKYKQNDNVE